MSFPPVCWTLSHPALDGSREVCGFRSESKALDHFRRHFLDEEEMWHQLVDEPSPRHLRRQLSELECSLARHPGGCRAGRNCGPVIRQGITAYVEAVREDCSQVAGAAVVLRQDQDDPFKKHVSVRLDVATTAGVFAAFENAPASHLVTAFRPAPVDGTGRGRRQDFRLSAIRRLKNSIAESEALERRLGKTVKELSNEHAR